MTFTFLNFNQKLFFGSNQNDRVLSLGSSKTIYLGDGNNTIYSFGNNNTATSGSGDDRF